MILLVREYCTVPMSAQQFKDLRDHALSLPKFGTDTANDEV